jgi:hypothetical protein
VGLERFVESSTNGLSRNASFSAGYSSFVDSQVCTDEIVRWAHVALILEILGISVNWDGSLAAPISCRLALGLVR